MVETLIIADDLTGAADTGVKFAGAYPVRLSSLAQAASAAKGGPKVLSVNTETRHRPAASVAGELSLLPDLAPATSQGALIYKKIDSCLRGHVGLELSIALKPLGREAVLLAPAYPGLGRATIDGIHLVCGRPVAETEHARDPIGPVTDSRLSHVASKDNGLRVESLKLSAIREGTEKLASLIKLLLSSGEPLIICCDAETEGDLEVLARAASAFKDRLLVSGSGGLAEALARVLGYAGEKKSAEIKGPAVFFGGSASDTLRSQLAFLAEQDNAELVTLDLEALLSACPVLLPAPALLRPLILNLPRLAKGPDGEEKYSSLQVIKAFGKLAAEVVRRNSPGAVFLSG
ncbi:MAG: four-carbon acid sugar kinase family protein, partial [Deltaproteobacteria bacterium]|nr:four-carbon acid sugar kinase family protein [Deltaproteobacteria bacterium]